MLAIVLMRGGVLVLLLMGNSFVQQLSQYNAKHRWLLQCQVTVSSVCIQST